MSKITFTAIDMTGSARKGYIYRRDPHRMTVEDYVLASLAYDCYGNDLQRAEGNAQLTREAFARLLEVLADRGVLSVSDILTVLSTQGYEEERDHALIIETQEQPTP